MDNLNINFLDDKKLTNVNKSNAQISICKTLNIRHILDQILSFCEKALLLQCRFVSIFWKTISTLHLRNINSFTNWDLATNGKPLEKLTTLFYNRKQLEMNACKNSFICTRFAFVSYKRTCCNLTNCQDSTKLINNIPLRNFLFTYGANIERLALHFASTCEAHILTDESIMDEIENLLTVQAPNLKSFFLYLGPENDGTDGYYPPSRDTISQKTLTELELNQIRLQYSGLSTRKNYSLKQIILTGKVLANLLEMVYYLAPNLKQVSLEFNDILPLLEPRNRLNFLKILNISSFNSLVEWQILEKIARNCCTNHQKKLKLIKINFCFEPPILCSNSNRLVEIQSRKMWMISTILGSSWDSLEFISWRVHGHPYGVLLTEGCPLKWPVLMPRVKEFKLSIDYRKIETNLFPTSFSWCKTFPRLRRFSIHNFIMKEDGHGHGNIRDLIRFLNLAPIKTVKHCSVKWNLSMEEITEILRLYFPNGSLYKYEPF